MPIIRNIIVLTAAVMLIPSPPEDQSASQANDLVAPGLIVAASQTVSDLHDFCTRQPGICETAQYVAGRLELKAKYGAKLIYEWANEAGSETAVPQVNEADGSDALLTGSLKLAQRSPDSTLKLEDLIPAWREPTVPEQG